MIIAVGKTIEYLGFRASQPVLLRTTATAKAAVCLEMARSSFSASQVCQIICGDDSDEEYIFSGSDDDLGMDDLDDDNLEGDSDYDEALETHSTGLESIPSSDEAVEQADSLPGPSGLQSHSSRLQSHPLTGPASPPLLTPASPPPLQPQLQTQSRQGEARQCRPLPPSPTQSR